MDNKSWLAVLVLLVVVVCGPGMAFGACESIQEYGWITEIDGMDAPPDSYYVEQAAVYWTTNFPTVADPEDYYEVRGEFSNARFSSIQSYWGTAPFDHIYDFEIEPDPGSINPFRNGNTYPPDGENLFYTIRLEPVVGQDEIPDPENRPPNTLYVIRNSIFDPKYRITYRVYWNELPEGAAVPPEYTPRQWEKQGQKDLPEIHYISCSSTPTGNIIDSIDEMDSGFRLASEYPPEEVFAQSTTIDEKHWVVGNPNLAFANSAVVYIAAVFDESHDEIVISRFKAPTFPDTDEGDIIDPSVQQARYWSVCTHIPETMTTIDCLSDHEFVVDDDGYGTVVFSAPDKRPDPAVAPNWLPFGLNETTQTYGVLALLRHLLPSQETLPESPYFYAQECAALHGGYGDDFIACLEDKCAVADFSQEYYPTSRYANRAQFEPCPASVTVGFYDLSVYASGFGQVAAFDERADTECDGDMDGTDLYTLRNYLGDWCQ